MRTSDPFVPVPMDVIPKMLELASLKEGELLFDLGSGDGRILIVAARDFHAKAFGIEVRPTLAKESTKKIKSMHLDAKVLRTGFRKVKLHKADVLALYLSGYTLKTLSPKFKKELRRGSRIVTFDFSIEGWTPAMIINVLPHGWTKKHPVYLYIVT